PSDPGAAQARERAEIQKLIDKFGEPSFSERQAGSIELLSRRFSTELALDQLYKSMDDSNLEQSRVREALLDLEKSRLAPLFLQPGAYARIKEQSDFESTQTAALEKVLGNKALPKESL